MSGWGSYNGSYSWATPSNEYNPSFPSLTAYNPASSSTAAFTQGSFPSNKKIKKQVQTPVSVKRELITPKRTNGTPNATPKVGKPKNNAGGKRQAANQPSQWNGEWSSFQQSSSRGFSRRGRGSFRGGRGGFRRHFGPSNSKTDIPFVPLDDNAPAINLNCNPENVVAFHGFDSVFTTQHNFPVFVEGQIYTSCDHYYQCKKVRDLTGSVSEKLLASVRDENGVPISTNSTSSTQQSFSQMAKEALKDAKVDKSTVDAWRITKGLDTIQISLLAKASQSAHLREALKESTDHLLVHAFKGDSIYGTGCGVPRIKKWIEDLQSSGVRQIRIPGTFPLNDTTVQGCPIFAEGRNILGVILMLLRERIRKNEIEIVDMTKIFNSLRSTSEEKDVAIL